MNGDAQHFRGRFTHVEGREMYEIENVDCMPPFLISVVSDTDLWMYVSSRGGLTAGRRDADHALFPYDTEDRLHRAAGKVGPFTLVRTNRGGDVRLWEPWTGWAHPGDVTRRLLKDALGSALLLEERHQGLGLVFRYEWGACEPFGFVRRASIENASRAAVGIELLDGLLDVMPATVPAPVKREYGPLVDAYRRSEIETTTGLGLFALQSRIGDTPEPAEALLANVVWQHGLPDPLVTLSPEAADDFRIGREILAEHDRKGRSPAYLVRSRLELAPGKTHRWYIGADVAVDHAAVVALLSFLRDREGVPAATEEALAQGRGSLRRIVAAADGLQHTADRATTEHHAANVLFNAMRGGVFADGYRFPRDDFADFVRTRNARALVRHGSWVSSLPETLAWPDLRSLAAERGDPSLTRLVYEYLPLFFSRRHGDPSRPWNRFSIRVRMPGGGRRLAYEGNWRDIFQNWEGLCLSYPEFIEAVIAKFLNATTADGFNAYRITREGIDWETPDPGNPWASIGYWGDHQIIYLTRLLEWSRRFHPGRLEAMLNERVFTYADLPYRLRSYEEIVADSRRTIDFDRAAHDRVMARCASLGADGRLLLDGEDPLHVTLAEKLLVPILAKLAGFVADGGIWMNTQRPEWNDANNALAGYGLSMVTVCYLRRHLSVVRALLESGSVEEFEISSHVVAWLRDAGGILDSFAPLLRSPAVGDADRRRLLDALGLAFHTYRERVLRTGPGEPQRLRRDEAVHLLGVAGTFVDHAIAANRRRDGLYHAYNLIRFGEGTASVERLHEMLEGQVAVLSSGALGPEQALEVIDALYASGMYRPDQRSFMLYPNRDLPGFLERNEIPNDAVRRNPLLRALAEGNDRRLVRRDANGCHRFESGLINARVLRSRLDELAEEPRWRDLVEAHGDAVLEAYEATFSHRTFTGRSGGMYGYEGLGCIYWHMIGKLLVAVGEAARDAARSGADPTVVKALVERYRRIRDGLPPRKSAVEYGTFPTDPYSHTPRHAGAQQPGMTGYVKEWIVARRSELGVEIEAGRVHILPLLIHAEELLPASSTWSYVACDGRERQFEIPQHGLAFTVCQTPVILRRVDGLTRCRAVMTDGTVETTVGGSLPLSWCESVFRRDDRVERIEVDLPPHLFTQDLRENRTANPSS